MKVDKGKGLKRKRDGINKDGGSSDGNGDDIGAL